MSKRFYGDVEVDVPLSQSGKKMKSNTYSKKKRYVATSVKGAIAKQVRTSLARMAEKKEVLSKVNGQSFGGGTGNTQLQIYLTPNASTLAISQGSSVAQRLGNKIRVKKGTFKGQLYAAPYDVGGNALPAPQNVKMYFVTDLINPQNNTNPTSANFFREGSSVQPMAGSSTDPFNEVNREQFKLWGTAEFKLGYAAFIPTPGLTAGYGYYTNNDFSENCKFDIDITKWLPKTLVFADTALLPTSRALYVIIESTNACNNNPNQLAPAYITYCVHLEFTDV